MDAGLLADPGRCPSCGASLHPWATHCPACALPLRGPDAMRLWEVSVAAAGLLAEREQLIARLRRSAESTPPPTPTVGAVVAPAAPAPGAESSRQQVQNLLLGLGVLLLAVAAVIFTVVTWGRLGIGGRAAVLAAATALTAATSRLSLRRGLGATAEATAVLTVGLLLLDAYAVRRVGLAGLDQVSPNGYWASALAVVAGLAALAAPAHPLVSVRLAAAVIGQLPAFVVAALLTEMQASALLVVQAGATAVLAARLSRPETRVVLGAGALIAYLAGAIPAVGTVYGQYGTAAVPAAIVLALAAAVALVTARVWRAEDWLRHLAGAAATLTAFAAVHGPFAQVLQPRPAAGYAAALVLGLTRVPTAWRTGALAAAALPAVITLLALAEAALEPVAAALRPVADPWSLPADRGARALVDLQWADYGYVPGALALLAVAALLAGRVTPWARFVPVTGAVLGVAAWHVAPLAADAPYVLAVVWDVLAGGALVVLGVWRHPRTGWPAAVGMGALLGGLGLAWSLAAQPVTLLAVGLALVAVLAALAVDRPGTWPALLATGVALGGAESYSALRSVGWPADRAGFLTVVLCGLLAVAGGHLLPAPRSRAGVEVAAAATAAAALLPTLRDPGWTSHTLLAAGVAAALVATRAGRHRVGWAAGALLTASSWTRLALEEVTAPEAYTVPPALALLAVGLVRQRRQPGLSSWAAYGPGLSLALVPSLLAAVGDPGLERPLLLGLAAIAVTLAGARARLEAPLLVGGAVLAVDAVVQLAPYVDALPRWVSVGAAGLALVLFGATYERRLRDLRRLQDQLRRLG